MTCKFNNYVDLKVTFDEFDHNIYLTSGEYSFRLVYKHFYCMYGWGGLFEYTPCIRSEDYETLEYWNKWIKNNYG